jgi:hypothetical protein
MLFSHLPHELCALPEPGVVEILLKRMVVRVNYPVWSSLFLFGRELVLGQVLRAVMAHLSRCLRAPGPSFEHFPCHQGGLGLGGVLPNTADGEPIQPDLRA